MSSGSRPGSLIAPTSSGQENVPFRRQFHVFYIVEHIRFSSYVNLIVPLFHNFILFLFFSKLCCHIKVSIALYSVWMPLLLTSRMTPNIKQHMFISLTVSSTYFTTTSQNSQSYRKLHTNLKHFLPQIVLMNCSITWRCTVQSTSESVRK